jgi:anaerobic selenocysteine-containing dehydrogenase
MSEAKKTTDRKEIEKWATQHGGVPSIIKGTEDDGKGEGVLRIHFPKKSKDNDSFEEISWDEFFKEFEDKKLAILLSPDSNFSKLVKRD